MVLAAMAGGLPSVCPAQVSGPAGQVVTLPPEAGGFGGAYSSPSFGDSGYGEVTPAGGYSGSACPPQGCPPTDCPPQPTDCWPWKVRPLFISPKMLEPPRGTYVRLEYLLWEIEEPGAVALGAPVIRDPAETAAFAPATDNTTSNGYPLLGGGFGYTPIIDEIQLRDNSGTRVTLGVPLKNYGAAEFSGWWLNQASDQFTFGPRVLQNNVGLNNVFVPTTPLAVGGVDGSFGGTLPTGLFQVYDTLQVDYSSDLKGADARFVVNSLSPPGEGLKLRPLFGFKYVGLQEAMFQKGQLDLGGTPFLTTIGSDTDNTILGGTVGLRTELVHRWFIVGVEPAVTLGGNIAKASVVTDNLAGPTEGRLQADSDYFGFSPILDLKAYARVCVTDNIRLHVGYDAFWLAQVYRPARVIEYNVDTNAAAGFPTQFDTKQETDHLAVEGLSVGLEFLF